MHTVAHNDENSTVIAITLTCKRVKRMNFNSWPSFKIVAIYNYRHSSY